MKTITFDIETIPRQNLPEGVRPEFDPDSVKLGNVKDPSKIDDKIQKAREEFVEGLDKKMSLDPDLCEVVMVSFSTDGKMKSFGLDIEEYERVYEAWSNIISAYQGRIPLVSFNGIGFDLPVLLHSAIRLDVPVSPFIYSAITPRYGNHHHYDLMRILTGEIHPVTGKSLDFYLQLFGLGAKSGDGSQVYGMWQAKEYDKLKAYCEQDVLMTAKLFERVEPWIVKETEE